MTPGATRFSILFRQSGDAQPHRCEVSGLRGLVLSGLAPARAIPNRHGQTHRVGFYASTKAGGHLPFESGLERLRLQFLDFDRDVTTFFTQPFTLEWEQEGRTYHYTPDVLLIRSSGQRVVEDFKPARFHVSARNRRAFDAAREALTAVGIQFRLWAPPEPTVVRNVQYLAGYRRPPATLGEYVGPVLAALRDRPRTLGDLAEQAGPPPFTRPVIYHLIWNHRIGLELTRPLGQDSVLVWQAGRA